jgi:hypothetical protein
LDVESDVEMDVVDKEEAVKADVVAPVAEDVMSGLRWDLSVAGIGFDEVMAIVLERA